MSMTMTTHSHKHWTDKGGHVRITFFKDTINSVVSIHPFALADLVHQLDHGAVELTLHEDAVLPN